MNLSTFYERVVTFVKGDFKVLHMRRSKFSLGFGLQFSVNCSQTQIFCIDLYL